nr:Kelch-like protein [Ipomoea batatas]
MRSKKKNTGRHPMNKVVSNISAPARNLPKNDLGGVIFGCKDHTIRECFSKTLFGLPAPHFAYVKKISPGLPLFLFNYSDRKLHGVFEAAHHGQLNIDPHAWTGGSVELTKYPAQVQFNVNKRCPALTEKQFSPIIANNYYETRHFWFELDRFQTAKLVELFSSSSSVPYDGLHHSHHNILSTLPTSEASTSGQQKTFEQTAWSSLFKDNSTSDMTNKFGNLKIASHPNFPSSRQPNEEWNSWTSEERAEKHNIQPLLETPGPSVGRDYLEDQSFILSENSVIAKLREDVSILMKRQTDQEERISTLEKELVQSRVEYQKLKNRVLQAGPGPSSQQFTEKDSQ